ncbi:MAG: carboxylating nicotinate-nucleotide diphosphorylase [candidate division Zixibacteria bacterium]|nr:carboxylating nicotinate-nucleotide diphosphorylase [candidate division Zixibacteria bacterium]
MSSFDQILLQQVELALMEDVGPGDITTLGCIEEKPAAAEIVAKSEGILAGLSIMEAVFRKLDGKIEVKSDKGDGLPFDHGDTIAEIRGNSRAIMTGERTALNFLGHLSGIATLTGKFVEKVSGTKAIILDTRKTTPGLRYLEKYAVACGGGENHRFGLFDMVLIKDNHIAACGSVAGAVEKVRKFLGSPEFKKKYVIDPSRVVLEVEVVSEAQLKEAVDSGIKRLLLDNQSLESLALLVKCARSLAGDLKLEASGNMNLDNVAAVAKTGVDYISIGALTHSATSADFSLRIVA